MKRTLLALSALILLAATGCRESMDRLTDRVFSTAAAQAEEMVARLDENTLPRSFENGEFISSNTRWWCSGFFPGTLWYIYRYTGDENFRTLAEQETEKVDSIAFGKFDHDLGFQTNCSVGNALRLGGDTLRWKGILVHAAEALAGRFSPTVGAIKSWDNKKWHYPVIIDNMMNLELLLEGTALGGPDSLREIAVTHAETTLKNHFRPDGSTYHLVDYDPEDGHIIAKRTVQGFEDESLWARGQAWGLYGYTMMYEKTGKEEFLACAEQIADLVIGLLPKDGIPYWDFNAPDIPDAKRDASAGAIMASALQRLSELTADKGAAKRYAAVAERQMRTLASEEYLALPGENGNFLLKHSVGHFLAGKEVDVPLTYADYYFLEALLRWKGLL